MTSVERRVTVRRLSRALMELRRRDGYGLSPVSTLVHARLLFAWLRLDDLLAE